MHQAVLTHRKTRSFESWFRLGFLLSLSIFHLGQLIERLFKVNQNLREPKTAKYSQKSKNNWIPFERRVDENCSDSSRSFEAMWRIGVSISCSVYMNSEYKISSGFWNGERPTDFGLPFRGTHMVAHIWKLLSSFTWSNQSFLGFWGKLLRVLRFLKREAGSKSEFKGMGTLFVSQRMRNLLWIAQKRKLAKKYCP